jgi:hypothetical protein
MNEIKIKQKNSYPGQERGDNDVKTKFIFALTGKLEIPNLRGPCKKQMKNEL